ncbi:MFS transporter [uncultured Muriicola sp.]|uniref:MFS transporter n=1 Tax=uncultured Muriicola sp. TaxID=1583102 RepID=UPI00260E291A|nr:MFS transporter [uncultured Muriicola sp.]
MKNPKWILATIVISQFCCISLWFAGNGVLDDLRANYDLSVQALGHLTSAVQFGFISGTLLFALFTIADRYSPSRVFFFSALIGAIFNLSLLWGGNTLWSLLIARFLTGFFLAGIYPVGMKIAADYFEKGLGKSLSFLVGALVLGTALPHLLKSSSLFSNWVWVIVATSSLAFTGGLLILLFVPDGPFRNKGNPLKLMAIFSIFKNRELKTAAIGYFGHMWELYAFWAFVPVLLKTYQDLHGKTLNISLWSFLIIGIGSIGCVIGGFLSQRIGVKKTAFWSLLLSCLCCLFSPLFFYISYEVIFLGILLFWGMMVIADSPLFSTMVANNADSVLKGSALTIVNCIGFAITIFSIQLLNYAQLNFSPTLMYTILAIGPVLGLWTLLKNST